MKLAAIDVSLCETLAQRGAAGDSAACRELVEHLWPFWVEMVRSNRSMGPLARSDDHVHNVVTRLIEKIGKVDGRGLRLYLPWRQSNPGKTFSDWNRIVTKNAIRDYMREQLGSSRKRTGLSAKQLLNEFATSPILDELGVRPPVTAAQTARELMVFAETRLPPEQYEALDLWLAGENSEEIAAAVGSTVDAASKLLRAAVATLRRHFSKAQ